MDLQSELVSLAPTVAPYGTNPGQSLITTVSNELHAIYRECVVPLEKAYQYDHYRALPLPKAELEAKPMVLLVGNHGTGKSTFIQNYIGAEYPGMRKGDRSATEKFTVVSYNRVEQRVPGQILQSDSSLPFSELSAFGNDFIESFGGSTSTSDVLRDLIFVDTPGVRTGAKHTNRGYSYLDVIDWFAKRSTRILFFFDHNNLEITQELQGVLGKLKPYSKKLRVILNKANQLTEQQLVRSYGTLMWNLCHSMRDPQELKVFISSFKRQNFEDTSSPIRDDQTNIARNYDNRCSDMFAADSRDLITEIDALAREKAVEKMNMVRRRCERAKLHALVMIQLRDRLPKVFKKKSAKNDIVNTLQSVLQEVAEKLNVNYVKVSYLRRPVNRDKLITDSLAKYKRRPIKMMEKIDIIIQQALPRLIDHLSGECQENLEDELINMGLKKPKRSAKKSRSRLLATASRKLTRNRSGSAASRATMQSSASMMSHTSVFSMASKSSKAIGGAMKNLRGLARIGKTGKKNKTLRAKKSFFRNSAKSFSRKAGKSFSSKAPQRVLVEGATIRARGKSRGSMRSRTSRASTRTTMVEQSLEENDQSYVDDDFRIPSDFDHVANIPGFGQNDGHGWVVPEDLQDECERIFHQQDLSDGKLTGIGAMNAFKQYNLPKKQLNKIWKLVDINRQNELDEEQFALAVFLIQRVKQNGSIPLSLTPDMVPPSHRM